MSLVTADDVLAYVGVKAPSQYEREWATLCAAAVDEGIRVRLNGEPRILVADCEVIALQEGSALRNARYSLKVNIVVGEFGITYTTSVDGPWVLSNLPANITADNLACSIASGSGYNPCVGGNPPTDYVKVHGAGSEGEPFIIEFFDSYGMQPVSMAALDTASGNELSTIARMAAGEAYKRREAPFGVTSFADETGAAFRLARDYLEGVKPQIDRYGNGPGIG